MKTKLIEATQNVEKGFNWGKFMIGFFSAEWAKGSALFPEVPEPLLGQCGWTENHILVMDLQTGEGAIFSPGGSAHADLEKHKIWVCPMFEPFLEWLYLQDRWKMDSLPSVVELPEAEGGMYGHRRLGVYEAMEVLTSYVDRNNLENQKVVTDE